MLASTCLPALDLLCISLPFSSRRPPAQASFAIGSTVLVQPEWLGLGSGLFICRWIGTPTLSLTCRNSIAVVRQWTNKKWTTHRHVCSSFLSNKIVFCFIFNMGNFSEENIPPERSILRQGHMKNLCDLWLDMWDSLTGRQQWWGRDSWTGRQQWLGRDSWTGRQQWWGRDS